MNDLLNQVLQQFTLHVRSYVRENIAFLKPCSKGSNENIIFATFNVISLYTIIMHAYGMEERSYCIDKHPGSLHERFNKQFVLESTRLFLENNNCKFIDGMFCTIKQHYKENNICPYIFSIKYCMGYFGLTFCRTCINEF